MSDKSLRERLLTLIRERAFRQGAVTLSSGQTSDFYVDGKMIEMMPEGAYLIGEAVFEEIKDLDVDAIGGLAVGAVPMVTSAVISCHHHGKCIEGFFVRAEAKGHGTRKVVEGLLPPKSKVVVVDDVVTTGKSVLQAIAAVEEQGCERGPGSFGRRSSGGGRGILPPKRLSVSVHFHQRAGNGERSRRRRLDITSTNAAVSMPHDRHCDLEDDKQDDGDFEQLHPQPGCLIGHDLINAFQYGTECWMFWAPLVQVKPLAQKLIDPGQVRFAHQHQGIAAPLEHEVRLDFQLAQMVASYGFEFSRRGVNASPSWRISE